MLEQLDGVRTADVSTETDRATVVYDATKVTVQEMIEAVRRAGYTATLAGT